MHIGSHEHKELFCRSFIESHLVYEPKDLPWPELDDRSLEILRAVPVWTVAVQVEINAGGMIGEFANTQPDPLISQALRLQGYEEDRHGRMLKELIRRYDLPATMEPPQLQATRRAFIDFGYDECLDSFFGFGIFKLAHEVQFMPESLMSLFARVIWEEARHIVFFVNWISYERSIRGYGAKALQVLPTAIGYARAVRKNMTRAGQTKLEDKGMLAVGDVFSDLTVARFLRTCLSENDTYMARFHPDLVLPRVVPSIARSLLRMLETGETLQAAFRSAFART